MNVLVAQGDSRYLRGEYLRVFRIKGSNNVSVLWPNLRWCYFKMAVVGNINYGIWILRLLVLVPT